MEYGIVIVEGEDEMLYQVLGSARSIEEVYALIEEYERVMGPESPVASVPPYQYVIHFRVQGFYTGRKVISDNDLLRLRRAKQKTMGTAP